MTTLAQVALCSSWQTCFSKGHLGVTDRHGTKSKGDREVSRFPLSDLSTVREQQRDLAPETCEPLAVRTARPPVLVQQSSCRGAPGVKRGESNFSACLWSAACWEGACAGKASVDQMQEALLRVQTNVCFYPSFSLHLFINNTLTSFMHFAPSCCQNCLNGRWYFPDFAFQFQSACWILVADSFLWGFPKFHLESSHSLICFKQLWGFHWPPQLNCWPTQL